jgi:hypothetical protein
LPFKCNLQRYSAAKAASILQLSTTGLPFQVLCLPSASADDTPAGAASLADVTVAALVAEVPFRAEQLVTRDGEALYKQPTRLPIR